SSGASRSGATPSACWPRAATTNARRSPSRSSSTPRAGRRRSPIRSRCRTTGSSATRTARKGFRRAPEFVDTGGGWRAAGGAIGQSAEFALVPAVAGEDRLSEANGWIETARYTGVIGGPLLGGALAAGGGVKLALLIDAASFAFVAIVIAGVRARRQVAPV